MLSLTRTLIAGAVLGCSASAMAQSAFDIGINAGSQDKGDVHKAGVILGLENDNSSLWQGENWRLALRHEVEAAYWDTKGRGGMYEVGYSPVFRLYRNTPLESGQFFGEASIGVRAISRVQIHDDLRFSTAFQFSDVLGVGYRWGKTNTQTVGLRVQHLSNASIKDPNPGINFATVYYQYRF